MKTFTFSQNRRLLLRSYLIIVGGFVVVATALDYGFARLQQSSDPVNRTWVDSSLLLVETYLLTQPLERRLAAIDEIEEQLGYPVKVIPLDHVVQAAAAKADIQELVDADGRPFYLLRSTALDAAIKIGPVAAESLTEQRLLMMIPPLLYLSLFAIVAIWVWPLIRDLNVLTDAAHRFAEDYRRPTNTAEVVTSLGDLAASLDQMSARITQLITGQKELTGALSHEMRTPLARIKFAIAVLAGRSQPAEELLSIEQDVKEIDGLVAAMLEYSRLDHADTEVNWQLTPVDAWMHQVTKKFSDRKRAPRVSIEVPAETVLMDPYLMELAMSNLLINACRYANKLVLVRFERTGNLCVLSVDDDGHGIAESDREIVFKAFTRLDNSRNRETGGYGLGLAVVKRIATLHSGHVRIEQSRLGGARFVLEWEANLPVVE